MSNLVIVMAGDQSLHEEYAFDRDFELWVCYWGDDDSVAQMFERSADRFFRIKGQKWSLVREVGRIAREQELGFFSKYDYVFLPDDDIRFPNDASGISKAFSLATEVRADVFQPAISNDNYSWGVTRRLEGAICHAATAVEIMMPAYSGEMFNRCVLPLLHIVNYVRAGWGVEPLITRFGEAVHNRPIRSFVLDKAPAIHTRTPGAGTAEYELGMDEAFLIPLVAGLPPQELARFGNTRDAVAYDFPASDDLVSWAKVEKHFRRVRGARQLHTLTRRKNLAAYVLNGLQKLAGRYPKA